MLAVVDTVVDTVVEWLDAHNSWPVLRAMSTYYVHHGVLVEA